MYLTECVVSDALRRFQEKKAAETAREKEVEDAKDEKRRLMEAQRYVCANMHGRWRMEDGELVGSPGTCAETCGLVLRIKTVPK